MRIRSIKPEFWRSDDITSLPVEDRLLFIGLWSYVDDNGVGRDDISTICADLFAHDMFEDFRETVARVTGGLARLSEGGLIDRYTVSGRAFLHVAGWERHQRVDKPNKPRYPSPDRRDSADRDSLEGSSRDPREIPAPGTEEQRNRGTREQGNEGTEEQGVARGAVQIVGSDAETPAKPPRKRGSRIPEPFNVTRHMREWAAAEVPTVNVDAATRTFVDYWRAESGAKASKVDWTAAWRNWLRKDADTASASRAPRRESSIARRDQQAQQMFDDLASRPALRAIGAHE